MGSTNQTDPYIAVIGDIVGSREIEDRQSLQRTLAQCLSELSQENPSIASAWTIVLGDEFQALYRSPKGLMRDIWRIQALLFPHKARFSIGLGSIETDIDPKSTLAVDGPAFHEARAGMQALKGQPEALFAVRQRGGPLSALEETLNLAALIIQGGRGRARLDLAVEMLHGRDPTEIGGDDASEIRRIQKLRKESGMEIVVGALMRVEAELENIIAT